MITEIDSKITDSEWEVMRVVWAQDEVTSKEIIEVLQQKKIGNLQLPKPLLEDL